MTRSMINRPEESEYLPYYHRYIALVAEGDIVTTLEEQNRSTMA